MLEVERNAYGRQVDSVRGRTSTSPALGGGRASTPSSSARLRSAGRTRPRRRGAGTACPSTGCVREAPSRCAAGPGPGDGVPPRVDRRRAVPRLFSRTMTRGSSCWRRGRNHDRRLATASPSSRADCARLRQRGPLTARAAGQAAGALAARAQGRRWRRSGCAHRRRRHAWVLSKARHIRVGVVNRSAHCSAGGSRWEVDRLHVARRPGRRGRPWCDSLLEEAAGRCAPRRGSARTASSCGCPLDTPAWTWERCARRTSTSGPRPMICYYRAQGAVGGLSRATGTRSRRRVRRPTPKICMICSCVYLPRRSW